MQPTSGLIFVLRSAEDRKPPIFKYFRWLLPAASCWSQYLIVWKHNPFPIFFASAAHLFYIEAILVPLLSLPLPLSPPKPSKFYSKCNVQLPIIKLTLLIRGLNKL